MIETPWHDPNLIWIPIPRAGLPDTAEPEARPGLENELADAMFEAKRRAEEAFEAYRKATAEAEALKRALVRITAHRRARQ